MLSNIKYIVDSLAEIRDVTSEFLNDSNLHCQIEAAAQMCILAISKQNKIMIAGNGGSAADAQHFAAELVGRFEAERRALAAIALSVDTSIITSLSNDYEYEKIFSRQIEAIGRQGDVLIVISTSGRSKNIIAAVNAANERAIKTIALCGPNPAPTLERVDCLVSVNARKTQRIQELHQKIYHMMAGIIEQEFKNN
jgi:D-sedoheptulose 7-phosphate isomerase